MADRPARRESSRRQPAGTVPRSRALAALVAVDSGGGSQTALRDALDQDPPIAGADRGLVTAMVYGALRHQRRLDSWLEGACARGLTGMDAPLLASLRLGAVQLGFLSRIPAFAAIDTTVEASKAWLGPRQVSFVHGVLRTLTRKNEGPSAELSADLPPWMARRIGDFAIRLDETPEAMVDAFAGEAPLHIHLVDQNRAQLLTGLSDEGVELTPVGDIPGAYAVGAGDIFASGAFKQRQLIAQDGGSAAVVEWLAADKPNRVLDLAAGRGAKSLFLSANGAEVTAVDINADKLAAARALARHAGHPLHAIVVADGRSTDLPTGQWDAVLVDAPCTGLGTLRRRPEIRHRRRAADILRLAGLQAGLLAAAATHVRPGGLLLYATCSPLAEEGAAIVDALLAANPTLERSPGQAPWIQPWLDDRGDFHSHPLRHNTDAFFAARLRRRTED